MTKRKRITTPPWSHLAARLGPLAPSWRQALRMPAVSGLLALLLVQLAAALVLAGQGLQRAVPNAPLLAIAPEKIDTITLRTATQTLRLERTDAGWVLPALDGFPADPDQVEQLLAALSALPRSLPVAASAASRQRLQVGDDNAKTRIRLLADGEVRAELLTGDSPGFRRLYGRLASEEEVYDLPLPSFLVTSDSDDWVRRDQLRLEAATITRISSADWTLVREPEGEWQLGDGALALDQAAVAAFVRRLANLSYQGVTLAAPADASSAQRAEPALDLEIALAHGRIHQRRVHPDEADGYLLRTRSDRYRYRLSEYDLEGVLGIDLEALTRSAQDEPPTEEQTTAEPPPGTSSDTLAETEGPAQTPKMPEPPSAGE